MITIKIEKYKEPEKYVYKPSTTQASNNDTVQFDDKEITEAKELSISLGIVEGLILRHEPTGHLVTITGWVDKNKITHYKGNPCVLKALRDRQGYQWETVYSVDELMAPEYKTVHENQPGATA